MMLKFSLGWSRGPPKHRLISELETALDLQRIRNGEWERPAISAWCACRGPPG